MSFQFPISTKRDSLAWCLSPCKSVLKACLNYPFEYPETSHYDDWHSCAWLPQRLKKVMKSRQRRNPKRHGEDAVIFWVLRFGKKKKKKNSLECEGHSNGMYTSLVLQNSNPGALQPFKSESWLWSYPHLLPTLLLISHRMYGKCDFFYRSKVTLYDTRETGNNCCLWEVQLGDSRIEVGGRLYFHSISFYVVWIS